jgi:hypothetical protein
MPEGPFIQVATFCDKVTRSESGRMTIHDCLTGLVAQAPAGPIPGGSVVSVPIEGLTFSLSMWSGQLKGEYELIVSVESPDGTTQELDKLAIILGAEGEGSGLDLVLSLPLNLARAGTYWFSIWIAGSDVKRRRFARVPLEITFLSASTAAEPVSLPHAV